MPDQCVLCDKSVDSDDYCYGCKSHVCSACGEAPWGAHISEDHEPPCEICGEQHPTDECPNGDK